MPSEPRFLRFSLNPKGARFTGSVACPVVFVALLGAANSAWCQESAEPTPPDPSPAEVSPTAGEDSDSNPYEGRMVLEVRFDGLKRVTDQYVRNQIRTQPGRPLEWSLVREDLRRLERLGEFREIQAEVLVDPTLNVVVLFKVVEAPIVESVDVVGNRQLSDSEIQEVVGATISLIAGIPIDDYQIGRAQRAIEELYREKGYYLARVTVDESELESGGVIIFRIAEGERIKVTSIRFEGNDSITDKELRTVIKTQTAGLFQRGAIDDTVLDGDAAAVVRYYLDRGYLDVRASRQIQPSPDGKEAIVTFLVDEGRIYTLRDVRVELGGPREPDEAAAAPEIMSVEQVRGLIELKPGDAFSAGGVQRSVDAINDAYKKMGYVDAQAEAVQLRDSDLPFVDLRITVIEGERYRTGVVYIQGNDLTQQKVIRREVTIRPDRWLDATEAEDTERRLRNSGLFVPESAKVTIQPEDPANPGYRDVLVEVEETNTGTLTFGAAVSSDAGLIGAITLNQRNFDIADTPDSFDEFIRGRAFRGAGQTFTLSAQPGTEESNYSISLVEPYLFDSPNSLGSSAYYRERDYDEYDEERYGARIRLARRFGERWTGGLNFRAENINIEDVSSSSAVDIQEVEGSNIVTSIGPVLTRTTVDSRFRPTEGTYTEFGVEQVGAMGGDYTFTKLYGEHQLFFPIDEDVLGNRTVLSFKTRLGYIPQEDEAPVFERFYTGGRSFRGFRYRGVGPIGFRADGTQTDDHVGGEWLVFVGAEVEKPIWRDILAAVVFVDSGTLTNEVGFEDYRVSVGTGIRLYIPQLGQAPLAFDFAFPLSSEDSDRERGFSFSLDIPIQ